MHAVGCRTILARVPRGVLAIVCVLAPAIAHADGRLLDDDTFASTSKGNLVLDGGLLVGEPAALPSGMSTGLSAGITRMCGCHFEYGARIGWSTTTEYSEFWTVTHEDMRLRAIGGLVHRAGRGTVSLRLALGATIVHEDRTRNQTMETALDSRAFDTLPAADLEASFAVHIAGPWLAIVSAGPSFDYFQGSIAHGWMAEMGVAWQP